MSEIAKFKPGYEGIATIICDPSAKSEIIIIAPDVSSLEEYLAQIWWLDWKEERFKPVRLALLNQEEK